MMIFLLAKIYKMKTLFTSAFLCLTISAFAQDSTNTKSDSASLDYGMRIYDARIGHFASVDPKTKPQNNPYQFSKSDTTAIKYCQKGEELVKQMKLEEAYKMFDKAVSLEPTAKHYTKRGVAILMQGGQNEALKDFDKALSIDNKFAEAYFFKGVVFQAREERTNAIEQYSKAIEADPNYADAYLTRGLVKGSIGENEDACIDIKKAVDLGSEKAASQYQQLCK